MSKFVRKTIRFTKTYVKNVLIQTFNFTSMTRKQKIVENKFVFNSEYTFQIEFS